ncbi:MAG TPA: hypothetical protein VEN81_04595, partial [Planctomycetota bacterium]|nr:hypothetical protein [Planctomycetota bacterium]
MKNAWIVACLVVAGCSSSPEPAPAPAPAPANPALSPKEQQVNSLRAQIAGKRAELAKADAELAQIAAEREQVLGQPASNEKNDRLVQLGQAEANVNQKKSFLNSELSSKQQELQDLVGGPRPKSADDALDSALEADAKREADTQAARKSKEDAARNEEARKVAQAEAAKIAEEEAKKKEMVQGGRAAAPGQGDETSFEERWAD